MKIGIVGHERAKFTVATEAKARERIRYLIAPESSIVVSGGCHLGGVDIWAEEEAGRLGREKCIYRPSSLTWPGFKARNLLIAQNSDEVHCIVVAELPVGFVGMRFEQCYHCQSSTHVKSGGCWTVKQAQRLGKLGQVHVISSHQEESMGQDTMISFKSGSPKLTPDILGADAAVLTIAEFKRDQQTRIGPADVLVFTEFPGHGWYANTTSLKAIATVYGPDYSKWVGKKVPLEARQSTIVGGNKPTVTLWCAGAVSANDPFDRALWDKALAKAKKLVRK